MPTPSHNPAQLSFAKTLFAEESLFDAPYDRTVGEEAAFPEEGTLSAEATLALLNPTLPIVRVELVTDGDLALPTLGTIRTPQDAVAIFSRYLQHADREHCALLLLDTKNQVLAIHTVSIGILDQALIHPREVFKSAILANAAAIMVCHNHPSGDPEPSPEDRRVTERLAQSGITLGIEVMDHLILGNNGRFVSLKERGVL